MSYPMFQKRTRRRTAFPEIWLGLPFVGESPLHRLRLSPQAHPSYGIWAAVHAPAMDGPVTRYIVPSGQSLLSVRETCGALRPLGSETTSYPMFQKKTRTRTVFPEIWLGVPFVGASLLHRLRLPPQAHSSMALRSFSPSRPAR